MRRLGRGQTVVFCVPQEIQMKITQCMTNTGDGIIRPKDVLKWSIIETYADMQRNMPLWAAQGRRFERQQSHWTAAWSNGDLDMDESLAMGFLEPEAQSLSDRYSPYPASKKMIDDDWTIGNQNVARINDRCEEFGALRMNSASLQEEQERELAPEVEQERQLERPAPAKAATHLLHQDVTHFATVGELRMSSPAFLRCFETFGMSFEFDLSDLSELSAGVLVTKDFAETVKRRGIGYVSDDYQQPVQWVLTTASPEHANRVQKLVVISSFEAQKLLPIIKEHKKVTLHIYAPRVSLAYQSADTLDLFTVGKAFDPQSVPRRLIMQLNLFAGLLYRTSFADYKELCSLLNLATGSALGDIEVAADGFILSNIPNSRIKNSPIKFLKTLMTKVRRNCESIEKTHIGKILDGKVLSKEDFESG